LIVEAGLKFGSDSRVMTDEKYVIIGEGIAGGRAAETLRELDEDAEIQVFTDESEPLYNRIMLKNYMKGTLPKQYARLRDEDWYSKRSIDLNLETRIENVDTGGKTVEDADGNSYSYEKLLVATGGSPRRFPLDEGYENVNYMWTMGDASNIKENAEQADRAVVIGGGLLGIDLALAYAEHDAETFYLIRSQNWWSRGLDQEGGEIMQELMEDQGVTVMTETEATDFKTRGNSVENVKLDGGREIENVDSVAVAIGHEPNSELVDVEKNEQEMIKTDEHLQTSAEDVYAAGSMVEYQSPVFERRIDKGAWDHSEEMGETAARNMYGEQKQFDYVNTYGVGHFSVQFLAVGDWSGEGISKKYSDREYRRLFFSEDKLVGAVMIGFTKGQEKIREFIKERREFSDKEKLLCKDFWE
jgi:NAD(P)H-nitrite reductase large subunit